MASPRHHAATQIDLTLCPPIRSPPTYNVPHSASMVTADASSTPMALNGTPFLDHILWQALSSSSLPARSPKSLGMY